MRIRGARRAKRLLPRYKHPVVRVSSRKPAWLDPADVATGWVGAGLLLPIELVALKTSSVSLLGTTLCLFAALGWLVGLGIAGGQALANKVRLSWLRAGMATAPSLLAFIPVGLHLFDGAKASTLPGAAYAPVWFPAVAWLSAALAVFLLRRVTTTRSRRMSLGGALLAGALFCEFVNRTVQRTGYLDVHTLMLVTSCVCAGFGARLVEESLHKPWPAMSPTSIARTRLASAATIAAFVVALVTGMQTTQSRWQVATQGLHTRLLVRTTQGIFDLDSDGYANVLGGGDCNNTNALVNPGAREVPGNQIDENCDGLDDDVAAKRLASDRHQQQSEAEAWQQSQPVQQALAAAAHMNLLLLSIDALRADVVDGSPAACAQYPHLCRLLGESQHFVHAFAPSAGTDLSMAGVLTGQVDPFATTAPTLAEALKSAGRHGYAVIPSEVVRYVGKPILTRGVETYKELVNDLYARDVGSHSTSARTTDMGLGLLDQHVTRHSDAPFFLWLHYFDVHEHDELQPTDKRVRAALDSATPLARAEKYRRLVRLVDEEVGRVLQELARRQLSNNTVVVLLSDHGEGLGEDKRLPENHGKYLYNALTHVPLAIRLPGHVGRKISQPVSLLDVHPTMLELFTAAVGKKQVTVDGRSLLPLLLAGAPQALTEHIRPLPLNESDQFGVVLWPYKLLVRRKENLAELYDLRSDFAERHDMSAQEPQRVADLMATYGALSRVDVDRTTRGRQKRDRAASSGAHPSLPPR